MSSLIRTRNIIISHSNPKPPLGQTEIMNQSSLSIENLNWNIRSPLSACHWVLRHLLSPALSYVNLEIPNGQTPAPISSPTSVSSSPNSLLNRTPQSYMRLKNANDVVISAIKHPQTTILLFRSFIRNSPLRWVVRSMVVRWAKVNRECTLRTSPAAQASKMSAVPAMKWPLILWDHSVVAWV